MDRLKKIASELRKGIDAPSLSTREFLSWFDAERRGSYIVWRIREELEDAGIFTVPDFESTYLDGDITFELDECDEIGSLAANSLASIKPAEVDEANAKMSAAEDPTFRLSKLAAANQGVVSCNPDATIAEAVTIMLQNDFSQLPVMSTEREIKGVISWASIGSRMALSEIKEKAKDYLQKHHEVRKTDSIFDAIDLIVKHDYVIVRDERNLVSGIITASDLSLQFRTISEPFLLLSEIENLIRIIIDRRFDIDDIQGCADPSDQNRKIEGVADLNFGEYIRLLENPDRWKKLGVGIDRKTFCKGLDRIRQIRNDVMHFDPDGIPDKDLDTLRDYTKFLKHLVSLLSG